MQSLGKIFTNGLMVLGLSFGLTVSATAMSFSDFEETKALAEQGSSINQAVLGTYYSNGKGVRQDHAKALQWFQKSAAQGNMFAQFSLGYAYANGEGVRQDYAKALQWFQKSANQGNSAAQGAIGVIYEFGYGVRQNKTTAKEWYGKGCDNGDQVSCDNYKRLNLQGY